MNSKPIILVTILFMFGCSTGSKVVSVQSEQKVILSDSQKQGMTLNENNCKKCHRLFGASEFTIERWPGILDRMQKKAKITDQEKELIFNYLALNAKK